jgi:hypothetical protein
MSREQRIQRAERRESRDIVRKHKEGTECTDACKLGVRRCMALHGCGGGHVKNIAIVASI